MGGCVIAFVRVRMYVIVRTSVRVLYETLSL